MFISSCLSTNEKGHLAIDGVDVLSLAESHGTPLYCMSEKEIRKNCRSFTEALKSNYGENAMAYYASKALNCKEILRIVGSENMGVDVVSGGELYTARSVNFPAEKIIFHGNNKTATELTEAVDYGVGTIVVDNIFELELLNGICMAKGVTQGIMIRIKPGVEAHTHKFVMTGSIDSKFGFALENGEADEAVKAAVKLNNLKLIGIHCHIGSQIFEDEPFCEAARIMLRFLSKANKEYGAKISRLNLGGGFGIKYLDNDMFSPVSDMIASVARAIKDECAALGIELPFVILEPGRGIVGSAGITLYTVGGIKKIEGVRTYVSVDGGMPDNPRYALYGSDYTAVIANRAGEKADMKVTIAGKCCESGDLIQENTCIQNCAVGDIMAVLSTGAYNYSMASNYNRIPRPEMVLIRDKKPVTIIKRESYEDLTRNDI